MLIKPSDCLHDAASYGVPQGNLSVFALAYGSNLTSSQYESAGEATCQQFFQVWSVSLAVL